MLVDAGADMNIPDNDQSTALQKVRNGPDTKNANWVQGGERMERNEHLIVVNRAPIKCSSAIGAENMSCHGANYSSL